MKIDKSVIINIAFRKILPFLAEFICLSLRERDNKNWWKQYVINRLNENTTRNLPKNGSFEEYINCLDIQACLNIIIMNWRDIFIYKFKKNIFLTYAHLIKDIRNDIDAHYTLKILNTLSNEDIERYLDAIHIFMSPINEDVAKEITFINNNYENEKNNVNVQKKILSEKKQEEKNETFNNELEIKLRRIGKKFFIDYYNYIEDEDMSFDDFKEIVKIDHEDYAEKALKTRFYNSRGIIKQGLGKKALLNIIDSQKIDDDTKIKGSGLLS